MTAHEIEVEREESARGYELVCYVDGDPILTATRLEDRGASGPEDGGDPWTMQLKRHALSYCDGLDAASGVTDE